MTYTGARGLLKRVLRDKERRRQALARLPIEEKIRVLVRMQRTANEIRLRTGRTPCRVWTLEEGER